MTCEAVASGSVRIDLDRESVAELAARLRSPLSADDRAAFDYDDVAFALSNKGSEGLQVLVEYLDDPAEERVRAAILGVSTTPGGLALYSDRVVRLLEDPRSGVVTEAVHALARVGLAMPGETARALAAHPSRRVQGGMIHYIASVDPRAGYDRAIVALRDPHPIVREAAADVLDELERPDAIPALSRLLDDPDGDVRTAAKTAIENLSAIPRKR